MIDVHNENTDAIRPTKSGLISRPTSKAEQRSALGDIRNKVSAIQIDPSKNSTAIKKEIIQQVNKQNVVLSKSKATSSLLKSLESSEHIKNVSQLCTIIG